MLLLPSEATTEDKINTCPDRRHPTYHRRSQIFKKMWIHAPRTTTINTDNEEETGQSRMRRGHWTRLLHKFVSLHFIPSISCFLFCFVFIKKYSASATEMSVIITAVVTKRVGEFKQNVECYQIIKD